MTAVELVRLTTVMGRTSGDPSVAIGLVDGPVVTGLPAFEGVAMRPIGGAAAGSCLRPDSIACRHGTFVAGILAARRGSPAPAICPGCTLLLRPIFAEHTHDTSGTPCASPDDLATALEECLDAGAHIVNLSLALTDASVAARRRLERALDHARARGVVVVAAAGNEGRVGSSIVTGHPWVVPVAACDAHGRPVGSSNLGRSIGLRGLSAPGEGITSLGPDGAPLTLGGTSVAAPFVTGALALLMSAVPGAAAADVRLAAGAGPRARRSIVPPVLDAEASLGRLAAIVRGRRWAGWPQVPRLATARP